MTKLLFTFLLTTTLLVAAFAITLEPADARKKRSSSGHHRPHAAIVHVKGHTRRSTGKYVYGHRRTGADGTTVNNYSMKGNTNPFTGRKGTKAPTR